jgi:uncharacterized protein (DUF2237 family)
VAKNVLGGELAECCSSPMTGFYRTGCCETGPEDVGAHVVCAEMTEVFLAYSIGQGNDLSSSGPGFPGLVPGDRWCVCASRWQEAFRAGAAPPVVLAATHIRALEWISLDELRRYSVDGDDSA